MNPSAFITGITGQDGSYLAELLLSKNYSVHGLVRRSSQPSTGRIDHLLTDPTLSKRIQLHYGDLTDGQAIATLVQQIAPDEIYNLGAQSHVRVSFDQPNYTLMSTAGGALHVLEAARVLNHHKPVRVYQASSSEMFGQALETPQTETTPFNPQSPYGCAKVYAYYQTLNYRCSYGLYACNGILFNHESERRGESFVTRKITRAAARIAEGLQNRLQLGNLDAKRDWGDAKDYVEAMWLMLQQETPRDYVIATGKTHSIRDFLQLAFQQVDLRWEDYVEYDPTHVRPAEVDALRGDASLAARELGWRPTTSLEQLAERMVRHDLQLAQQEKLLAST